MGELAGTARIFTTTRVRAILLETEMLKTKPQKQANGLYMNMGFDDIMRRVSQIKPSKPKKNAKRKK